MSNDTIELTTIIADKLFVKLQQNFTIMPTLTLAQCAEQLGVSQEKVRELCTSGELPHIKLNKLYRIKPADLNDYLNKHYIQ